MVRSLPFPSKRLSHKDVVDTPFVLFTGTYSDGEGKGAIPKPVIEFIKKNHKLMLGVVASGNKSFGAMYAVAGDIISRNCQTPLLYKFELFGTETDRDHLIKILEPLLHEQHDLRRS